MKPKQALNWWSVLLVNVLVLLLAFYFIHRIDSILSSLERQLAEDKIKMRQAVAQETRVEKLRLEVVVLMDANADETKELSGTLRSMLYGCLFLGLVGGNLMGLFFYLGRKRGAQQVNAVSR